MREKLIKKLKIVITGLEDRSIHYNWKTQQSCNCGVVVQAMLEISAADLREKFMKMIDKSKFAEFFNATMSEVDCTWRNSAALYCPVTGMPTEEIFRKLYEVGMTREDFNHLEYLSNPLIFKRSGIDATKMVVRKSFFGLRKRTVQVVDDQYFAKKNNLIKYLKAWVEILSEELSPTSQGIEELRKAELHAVSDQDFEKAALIRDKIAELI